MPHSLAPSASRRFGRPVPAETGRWPVPAAMLAILSLSIAGWFLLIEAGRALLALLG